jgi:hypothetical protein
MTCCSRGAGNAQGTDAGTGTEIALRVPAQNSSGKVRARSAISPGSQAGTTKEEFAQQDTQRREALAAQFVAEFPEDDDTPYYPEGSRQATFLKARRQSGSANTDQLHSGALGPSHLGRRGALRAGWPASSSLVIPT